VEHEPPALVNEYYKVALSSPRTPDHMSRPSVVSRVLSDSLLPRSSSSVGAQPAEQRGRAGVGLNEAADRQLYVLSLSLHPPSLSIDVGVAHLLVSSRHGLQRARKSRSSSRRGTTGRR
jgi:hypothetical protein